MPAGDLYTVEEWVEIERDSPLSELPGSDIAVMHRHFLWADHQKRHFASGVLGGLSTKTLHEESACTLFLWYGLLWSVIEAYKERTVELRGELGRDIDAIADPLRKARNAVFHVSRKGYYDERLFEIMSDPDSVVRIYRVHGALGQLLLDEMRCRMTGQVRGEPEPS